MDHSILHRPSLWTTIHIVPTVQVFAIEERLEIFSSNDSTSKRQGSNEK
jgi:hypothetical protein